MFRPDIMFHKQINTLVFWLVEKRASEGGDEALGRASALGELGAGWQVTRVPTSLVDKKSK